MNTANLSLFLSYGIFKCLVDVVRRLHTVVYSPLGWTTRGRHHTPVFRMFDWPLHRDFSLLFAISEVGSFTCIGCDSPIHGTDGLESPPKDLAMRIKRLAKGRYCRGGFELMRNLQYGSSRSIHLRLDRSATTAPLNTANNWSFQCLKISKFWVDYTSISIA